MSYDNNDTKTMYPYRHLLFLRSYWLYPLLWEAIKTLSCSVFSFIIGKNCAHTKRKKTLMTMIVLNELKLMLKKYVVSRVEEKQINLLVLNWCRVIISSVGTHEKIMSAPNDLQFLSYHRLREGLSVQLKHTDNQVNALKKSTKTKLRFWNNRFMPIYGYCHQVSKYRDLFT